MTTETFSAHGFSFELSLAQKEFDETDTALALALAESHLQNRVFQTHSSTKLFAQNCISDEPHEEYNDLINAMEVHVLQILCADWVRTPEYGITIEVTARIE